LTSIATTEIASIFVTVVAAWIVVEVTIGGPFRKWYRGRWPKLEKKEAYTDNKHDLVSKDPSKRKRFTNPAMESPGMSWSMDVEAGERSQKKV